MNFNHTKNFKLIPVLLLIASIFTVAVVGLSSSSAYAGETTTTNLSDDRSVVRFAGDDRYETGSLVNSDSVFTDEIITGWVVICSAENDAWPDSLCASALSGLRAANIVLVDGKADSLSDAKRKEIEELNGGSHDSLVYIVGGENTVSSGIESDLTAYGTVERIAGVDRYETSRAVYKFVLDHCGLVNDDDLDRWVNAVVCSGENFPDALSVGSYCCACGHALLLVGSSEESQTSAKLSILSGQASNGNYYYGSQYVIVGGESSVPTSFENWLNEHLNDSDADFSLNRVAGADRYETNRAFISYTADDIARHPSFGYYFGNYSIGVASGENFPDALGSSYFLGHFIYHPLLLIKNNFDTDESAYEYIYNNRDDIGTVYIFGGEKSVSESVENNILGAMYGYIVELDTPGHGSYEGHFSILSVVHAYENISYDYNIDLDYGYKISSVHLLNSNGQIVDTVTDILNNSFGSSVFYFTTNLTGTGVAVNHEPGEYTIKIEIEIDESLEPDLGWTAYYDGTRNDSVIKDAYWSDLTPQPDGSWTFIQHFIPETGYTVSSVYAGYNAEKFLYDDWSKEVKTHNYNYTVKKVGTNQYQITVPTPYSKCTIVVHTKKSSSTSSLNVSPLYGDIYSDDIEEDVIESYEANDDVVSVENNNEAESAVPLAAGGVVGTLSDDGKTAFAIYSADDHSLTFYADEAAPAKGDKYDGKTVTDVFTGFDSTRYSSASGQPWKSYRSDIYSVVADESFSVIQPIGMRYWFYGLENCTDFDLSNINTSQVNNMSYLFVDCGSVQSLDLSSWDTSAVQTMYSMFHQCYSLRSVDMSGFDTSNVTTFGYMFYQCRSLNWVDVSSFNTSKCTYFSNMFYDCESLTTIDLSGFDTAGATSMVGVFQKCSNLKHLDLSSWDTSKATAYSSFLKDDNKILDITIGDGFTLFGKSTSALVDIQTWYDSAGGVISSNYMIGFTGGAGTYYTYGIDFSDVGVDIVGNESSKETWAESESVNVNEAIEIEASTKLPTLHANTVAEGDYELTFHNKLDSGFDIDSLESDFKLEIDGNVINPAYYSVEISNTAATFDVGFEPLSITGLEDGCTFHVNVDVSALYNDDVISDDDFGNAEVRVFFYASLEDVEDVNTSYASTVWYDISNGDDVLHTSEPVTVEVYTFEIDINKTDIETGVRLSDAEFGLYSDASCCDNPVKKSGEDYVVTTDADGYAQFRGIAEGTYYVKEISAPAGYSIVDEPFEVVVALDAVGMNEHVYTLSVEDTKEIIDISDPDSGITVEVTDDGDNDFTYNGKPHTPHVTVTDKDGNELVDGEDYDVEYGDNTNAGKGHIIIYGRGGYTGDFTVDFDIAKAEVTIVCNDAEKAYGQDDPTLTGVVTGVVAGDDLYVTYTRTDTDEAVGTYVGVITATYDETNTNYAVDITNADFTITKADLSDETQGFVVSFPDGNSYDYTGSQITPRVEVCDHDGNLLTKGVDYTVSYGDNTEVGTGTVTVEGIGNYEGEIRASFKIIAVDMPLTNITKDMFTIDISNEVYTGQPIEKTITTSLVLGEDYVLVYKNNIDAGVATIVISGAGEYTGTVEFQFNIVKAFIRLAGDDRYKTMNKVDGEVFESSPSVVLTCGGNFPDSLTSAGLAGVYGCPIILTGSDVLSSEAAAEIEQLGAHTIYIVGGENSVSANIEDTLVGQGLTVERIAGADRYETARAVYDFSAGSWGISGYGSKTAIIAAGTTFADSLSASSYAWWSTSPIFLVNSNGVDAATAEAIVSGGFERIVIVGGTASVPTSVEVWASDVAETLRISGNDRYETSTKFAEWAYTQGMSFNNSAVSTGKNYPDALCGGALCGKCGSVLLLADGSNTSAVDVVGAHKDEISRMYFLGGVNSVSSEVFDLFVSALS